jgi:uncharacterized protein YdeI (YjbR/CyaY-like superfamily)
MAKKQTRKDQGGQPAINRPPRAQPKLKGARALERAARVEPASLADWRAWLSANHGQAQGVWLVYVKQSTGQAPFTDGEAVDEALCFGWIDSLPRKLDERRTMLYFAPRKRGSPWSAVNKAKIERLIASNRMRAPGLAKIEAAKADGSWTLLDAIERLEEPPDLVTALDAQPQARARWRAFPSSARKGALWIIASAKTPGTRAARIARCVLLAAQGKRLGQDR